MPIEGSVKQSASSGSNTITMPASDLTIVGVYAGTYYISIVFSPGQNAIIPVNSYSKNIQKVTFKPGTNQITYSVPTSCDVVFYYGQPLSGSKPLSAFLGVVEGTTTTASGTGTLTFNFPKAQGKMVGEAALLSASTALFVINTAVGKELTFEEFATELTGVDAINSVDTTLSNTVTVNYTSNAAQTFYLILYYS